MSTLRFLLFVLSFLAAPLVLAQEEEGFDFSGPGSEPLDHQTEIRLQRYVQKRKCPVTHNEEVRLRCEYLYRLADYEDELRRQRRLREREELRSTTQPLEVTVEPAPFDPSGPGSEPLDPNTEARLQRYISNNNCEPNRLRDPTTLTRCLYLLKKAQHERQLIEERRIGRLDVRRSRQAPPARSVQPSLEFQVRQRHPPREEELDLSGPGSQPLSEAMENRLNRYVREHKCPLTFDQVLLERCQFLLKLRNIQRRQQIEGTRGRTLVTVQRRLQRSVDAQYRSSITDVTSISRVRAAQGLRGRPRTLKELEEVYGLRSRRVRGETVVEPIPETPEEEGEGGGG
jgi:hypothetical protein